MLIYGYHIDTETLSSEDRDVLYDSDFWQGCYSVGCYQPYDGVFGKKLTSHSCLFYPIPVSELTAQPSEEQKKAVQEGWKELPESIRNAAKNKEPKVFIFDHTDD